MRLPLLRLRYAVYRARSSGRSLPVPDWSVQLGSGRVSSGQVGSGREARDVAKKEAGRTTELVNGLFARFILLIDIIST